MLSPSEKKGSYQVTDFLKKFLLNRFEGKTYLVELMLVSIIYSCFLLRNKFLNCKIFYQFAIRDYTSLELSYFIFIRAIIEKETREFFYDRNTGKSREIRNFYLTWSEVNSILEKIFGYGKSIRINRFKQKIFNYDRNLRKEDKLHVYDFMEVALVDYYKCRKYGKNYTSNDGIEDTIVLNIEKNDENVRKNY